LTDSSVANSTKIAAFREFFRAMRRFLQFEKILLQKQLKSALQSATIPIRKML